MGLYSRYVLPRVVHLTCSGKPITRQRMKVVPKARGRVLEVGIGSGLNLPFYDPGRVTRLWGLEPAPEMTRLAEPVAAVVPFEVEFVPSGAEDIPLESGSFDTVVVTYTLCTLPEPLPALKEIARVMAPGGRLLFCEHGLAPDPGVRRWQRWANPVWGRFGGGCRLDRDIPALLRTGGFTIRALDTMYVPGWRPANFNYWGEAVPGG